MSKLGISIIRPIPTLLTVLAAMICVHPAAFCGTVVVDPGGGGDALTIQQGIDLALNGDTVLVNDGTYSGPENTDLEFNGKAIVLISAGGPASAVIDCQNSGRGFLFDSGESTDTVIDGFTVTGGSADEGGGILCLEASPTLRNCVLTMCRATVAGGGIFCRDSAAIIEECSITLNETSPWGRGGGIALVEAPVSILECLIEGNTAFQTGGGVDIRHCVPDIIGCTLRGNSARNNGGAVHCTDRADPIIRKTLFENNTAEDDGGGVYCNDRSSPWIMANNFTGNQAGRYGGGVYAGENCSPLIRGNSMEGNTAYSGGGINCYTNSSAEVLRNLIIGNTAEMDGGGVTCYRTVSAMIGGNTVEYNLARDGAGISLDLCSPVITGNIIRGNATDFSGAGLLIGRESVSLVVNNLIVSNQAVYSGGGVLVSWEATPILINNTIARNSARDEGGGMYCSRDSMPMVENCIFWDNEAVESGDQVYVRFNASAEIHHTDMMGGLTGIGGTGPVFWGDGNLDLDPLWVPGSAHYYLSHLETGQNEASPCIDSGSIDATEICFAEGAYQICLDELTTRLDGVPDTHQADMGFHYPTEFQTISCRLRCEPASGTLPFSLRIFAQFANLTANHRLIAGRMELTLPGGTVYPNWRSGSYQLTPAAGDHVSWRADIPALSSLAGNLAFRLVATDITPAPYNQPPYAPSGDTDSDNVTVVGVRP